MLTAHIYQHESTYITAMHYTCTPYPVIHSVFQGGYQSMTVQVTFG